MKTESDMKPCPILLAIFLLASCARAAEPGKMKVTAEEERSGYRCFLVEYPVPGDETVSSYLLVPDGASAGNPRPGIVLLHDHGARFDIGKEKLARPLPQAPENIRRSSRQWVQENFDGIWLADSLASSGYVVIVPDMLYWGDRSSALCRRWSRMKFCGAPGDIDSVKSAVYEGQRAVYDSLAAGGEIWAEKTLKEDAAAAKLLKSLDFVDGDRIAAFGWSMGAHRAWLLAAFSQDVSCGVSVCWMTLKETQKQPYKASDYALLIPALRERYDFPDIACRLAPKPYLFLAGTGDRLFPAWSVEEAYSRMQSAYAERGAAGRLRTEFFDGGHHCGKQVQKIAADFISEQFGFSGNSF